MRFLPFNQIFLLKYLLYSCPEGSTDYNSVGDYICEACDPLVKPVLEMQRTNVILALQPNISTLLLVGMLALMEASDYLNSDKFVKPVTPLVKPVLEMQPINVSLVHQPNICTLILVGMLALMDHQTT
jgi:hypothetical protein